MMNIESTLGDFPNLKQQSKKQIKRVNYTKLFIGLTAILLVMLAFSGGIVFLK